jgi:DNA primase
METEGVTFPEAVERLAAEAGVALPEATPEGRRREEARASLIDVMELAARFFEATLQTREGAAARGYLSDRGLTPAIQAEFRLGFAPSGRYALRDHLAAKGIDRETMIEAGLLILHEENPVAYDRFRDRVMFPIQDASGKVIAFGGRAMAQDAQAKYLNSPETPLFHKGACLYNHHRARAAAHAQGGVIAVEGYVDAIMMSTAGFPHTVAPLGTALTEDQLTLLWRMSGEPILCFDGDKAGRRAAYRAADVALPHIGPGRTLRFALLPEGQDPDDLVRSAGAGAVADVLKSAEALADIIWARETESGDFATPERRAALERRLAEVLAPIRDDTVRKHYRAEMGARLGAFFSAGRATATGDAGGRARRQSRSAPSVAALVTPGVREGTLMRGGRTGIPAREGLILVVVIAHPALLDRHCEELAELEFENADADRLRRALVDCAAIGLRGAADVMSHLEAAGLGRIIQRLGTMAPALHWWARPDAALPDVEQAFTHVVTLHRKMGTLHRELKLAATALERDFTDENFAHLADIKSQISAIEGQEATIEGFGISSGRAARAM